MAGHLNNNAMRQLLEDDQSWLLSQPRTLERDHIEAVLQERINKTLESDRIADIRLSKHAMQSLPDNIDPGFDDKLRSGMTAIRLAALRVLSKLIAGLRLDDIFCEHAGSTLDSGYVLSMGLSESFTPNGAKLTLHMLRMDIRARGVGGLSSRLAADTEHGLRELIDKKGANMESIAKHLAEVRRKEKAVRFGAAYGASSSHLASQLNMSPEEVQTIRDRFNAQYPAIANILAEG